MNVYADAEMVMNVSRILWKKNSLLGLGLVVLAGCFQQGGGVQVGGDKEGEGIGNPGVTFESAEIAFGDIGVGGFIDKVVKVTATDTSDVYMSSISIDNTEFASLSNNCPLTGALPLRAKESCNFTIRFSPATSGSAKSAVFRVFYGKDSSDNAKFQTSVAFTGQSTGTTYGNQGVVFTPDNYNFGDIPVAPAFAENTFTVTNATTANVRLGGFTSTNSLFSIQTTDCPASSVDFAPNETCNIVVRFSPLVDGAQQGFLRATYGPDQPRAGTLISQAVIGGSSTNGPVGNSAIAFNPAYKDFGDVGAGDTARQALILTNARSTPIYLGGVTVDNSKFTIAGNNCPSGSSSLGAGAQCGVTLAFTPTADGSQAANLTVKYGPDEARNTTLLALFAAVGRSSSTAYGSSAVSYTPSVWDFQDVASGVTTSKAFVISNNSSSPVSIGSITRTSTSNFAIAHNCGATIAAAGVCGITVSFTPTSDGAYTSDITTNYGPDVARSSSIQGKLVVLGRSTAAATGNSATSFSPSFWDFGDVAASNTLQKQFTLTNSSSSAIYISSITRNPTTAYTVVDNCPDSPSPLAAAGTCTITVNFTPTADGGYPTDVIVAYGPDHARSGNLQSKVSMTGRSTAIAYGLTNITFDPNSNDFGDIAAGQTATLTGVTVRNTGTDPLVISSISVDNAKFSVQNTNCPTGSSTLAASASCLINVRFSPTADGPQSSNVVFTYGPDVARSGNLTSKMSVFGRSQASPLGNNALSFTPSYKDFGNIGNTDTQNIVVKNTSSITLYLGAVTVSGTSFSKGISDCALAPSAFAPGDECTVPVRFTPASDGTYTGSLKVRYGQDEARKLSLESNAVVSGFRDSDPAGNGRITASPASYDFGDQAIGSFTSQSFTITNNSASPIFFPGGSATPDNAAFAITSNTCTGQVNAAGTCNITVRFSPSATGGVASTVTVAHGTSAGQNSSLTGKFFVYGRSSASYYGNDSVTFSPAIKDFGDIAQGANAQAGITVTNSSASSLYMSAPSVTSTSGGFFMTTHNCPSGATALAAGSSCVVTVRFAPVANGADSATVNATFGPDQTRNSAITASGSLYGKSTPNQSGSSPFTYSPNFWDFGDVAAGQTVQKSVTVTNSSASSVYIGGLTRTNGTIFNWSNVDCPTSPTALTAGSSCRVQWSFSPSGDGSQNSTGSLAYGPDHPRSSSETDTYVVAGRSTAATNGNSSLSFSPSYYDYGDRPASSTTDHDFTITNTSTSPVYLSAPTSSNALFLLVPSGSLCPTGATALAVGGTCTIRVRFSPTSDGIYDSTITANYGPDQARNGNLQAKFSVAGRSFAALTGNEAISWSPAYKDFGDVAISNTVQQVFTITNASTSDIYIGSVTRSNTSAYTLQNGCPTNGSTPLAAAAMCGVTVTYAPIADGSAVTNLTIAYGPDQPRNTNLTSTIAVQGRSTVSGTGNTALTYSPTYADYGDVGVGSYVQQGITVLNSTTAAVYLGAVTTTNSKFSLTANTCPTGSTTLGGGSTCVLTVRYTPTTDGSDSATVSMKYGPDLARAQNLLATMSAAGRSTASPIGNTALSFAPSNYDFGDVAANTTVQKGVTVSNTSTGSIYIGGVTVSNSKFTITGNNCPTSPTGLAAATNCSFTLNFTPTADGSQATNITMSYGPDAVRSGNISSNMTANGRSFATPVGSDGIKYSPTYKDYGNIASGTYSYATITLSNGTASPLYIGGITAAHAEYSITADNCPRSPTSLAGASTCTLSLKYSPVDEGTDIFELKTAYGYDSARSTNLLAKMTIVGRSESIPIGNSAISLSPNNYDYGNVALSPSYAEVGITVTNNSTKTVYLGTVGGIATPFSITTATTTCPYAPTGIAPTGSCILMVRFSPVTGSQATMNMAVRYGEAAGTPTQYQTDATLTGRSAPVAPSDFVWNSNTGTTATFSWTDNSFDESAFEIQRCDGTLCGTTFASVASVTLAANSTSYTASPLTDGSLYRFRVRSVVSSTQSSWLTGPMMMTFSGVAALPTTDNGSGAADSLAGINCSTAPAGPYVNLKWTPVSSSVAAYYSVYEVAGGVTTFIQTVNNTPNQASNALLTQNLSPGQAKTYIVQAHTSNNIVSKSTASVALTTTDFSPCLVFGQGNTTNYTITGVSTQVLAPLAVSQDWYLNQPRQIHSNGTQFAVADGTNNRVLLWNNIPTSAQEPPDVVLGVPNRYSTVANSGGRSARTMSTPWGVFLTSNKLIVSDRGNNRILIYNTIPTTDFAAADVVLGQATFAGGTANAAAGSCNAAAAQGKGLNAPYGVWVDQGSNLYVADANNARVMLWNGIPSTTNTAANIALGAQANWAAACAAGTSANTLSTPVSMITDSARLYIVDQANNRVVIHNTLAPTFGRSLDTVIGQTSVTVGTAANTQNGLNGAQFMGRLGSYLYVSQSSAHRVSIFDQFTVTGVTAVDILGQTSYTGVSQLNSQLGLNTVVGLWTDQVNNKIWVGNYGQPSLKRYPNTVDAVTNAINADLLWGQPLYTTSHAQWTAPSATRMGRPTGIAVAGSKIVISDNIHNRVLLYNSLPTSNMPTASIVLGQTSVTGNAVNQGGGATSTTMSAPRGVWTDGTRLLVADTSNHRVLVWRNAWPSANGQGAAAVLGQPDMTTVGAAVTSSKFNTPEAVYFTDISTWAGSAGTYGLFVADRGNNRVAVFQTNSTMSLLTNGTSLVHIFGQTTATVNTAATTATGLSGPRGVWTDGTKLAIADTNNHRVLLWDNITSGITLGSYGTQTPPDTVLGQADFISGGVNGGLGAGNALDTTFNQPTGVWSDGTKLYVADNQNNRVLVWLTWPTAIQQPADRVIGQTSFTLSSSNQGNGLVPTANSLDNPFHVWGDTFVSGLAARLWITDGLDNAGAGNGTNARVLVLPSPQ